MNMEGKVKVENGNRIDRVIRREEAAELLGIHVRTLTRRASR